MGGGEREFEAASPGGSVTRWIAGFRDGQPGAVRELLDRYFDRMKQLARPRAHPHLTGGVYDEEDVALSAFNAFCAALRRGKYPELQDRNDLWHLLATFTLRKAQELARRQRTTKRGGAAGHAPTGGVTQDGPGVLDDVPGEVAPPDLLAMMDEEFRLLLGRLKDQSLEAVVVWKLEGYTNDEIATRLGYTRRTVQRMLALIRDLWESGAA